MDETILAKFVSGQFQLGYITKFCDICQNTSHFKQAMIATNYSNEGFLLNLCNKCEMETTFQRKEFQEKFKRSIKFTREFFPKPVW